MMGSILRLSTQVKIDVAPKLAAGIGFQDDSDSDVVEVPICRPTVPLLDVLSSQEVDTGAAAGVRVPCSNDVCDGDEDLERLLFLARPVATSSVPLPVPVATSGVPPSVPVATSGVRAPGINYEALVALADSNTTVHAPTPNDYAKALKKKPAANTDGEPAMKRPASSTPMKAMKAKKAKKAMKAMKVMKPTVVEEVPATEAAKPTLGMKSVKGMKAMKDKAKAMKAKAKKRDVFDEGALMARYRSVVGVDAKVLENRFHSAVWHHYRSKKLREGASDEDAKQFAGGEAASAKARWRAEVFVE